MKYSKEAFIEEISETLLTAKEDFTQQINEILDISIRSFQYKMQQELRNTISQLHYKNFERLQSDLIGGVMIRKGGVSIEQALKKLSDFIVNANAR